MRKVVLDYTTTDFGDFKVHTLNDNYSFRHIEISNITLFLKGISKFLLSEDNLLKFNENNTAIEFKPSKANYTKLYKLLYHFIDDENIEFSNIDLDIEDILLEEFEEVNIDGKRMIRLSKIGRLGEYIFHIFLSEYFSFNSIIPKIKLTSDKNMSVYGIDALFLDQSKEMLLFGESKVTQRLQNGISMINKSLEAYEKDISEEFIIILSNNQIKLNGLEQAFPGIVEISLTFEEFIENTGVTKVGVPIFIAHGTESETEEILIKLKKSIKRTKYFGLDTIFYVISLPILNKELFIQYLTNEIAKKMEEYQNERDKI